MKSLARLHTRIVPLGMRRISPLPAVRSMNTPAEPEKPDDTAWGKPSVDLGDSYLMPHPIWNPKWAEAEVKITHEAPKDTVETLAYYCVKLLRLNFDYISGFRFGERTVEKWLVRMVFLETVAAVPGMVSSMLRHFGSLRRMKRDRGFIHTLLEEAENERMHLMVAMKLYKPGPLFRLGVILTQGAFGNFWFLAYVLSPRFCHKFVGYLEEEAVKTYTSLLDDIDKKRIPWGTTPASEIARMYWKLPENATMRDVIVQIRADEAHHRFVNHKFSDIVPNPEASNPFRAGH